MKFSPKSGQPPTHIRRPGLYINLGNSDQMMDFKLRIQKLAKKRNLSLSELVRQMIEHCLAEMK